jgi:hypothetical protein
MGVCGFLHGLEGILTYCCHGPVVLFLHKDRTPQREEDGMDLFTGLGCLVIYGLYRLLGGKPNYVDSDAAKNFRRVRNSYTKDISGLKEVKAIKRRCFKG